MATSKVRSIWSGGNLIFKNLAGAILATFHNSNGVVIIPGAVRTIRRRFTVAEVNAGATLLAALGAGLAYRMVEAFATSVGGAAGAVTTVDISGTVSSARKLVAFAQASLTQSTQLKSGGTGAALLADGASNVVNDGNTAITVGKTGSDVTTATHIDIEFSYVIEAV